MTNKIPIPKSQIPNKFKSEMTKITNGEYIFRFRTLEFRKLEFVCDLVLGI
jgi:hypothetical protein